MIHSHPLLLIIFWKNSVHGLVFFQIGLCLRQSRCLLAQDGLFLMGCLAWGSSPSSPLHTAFGLPLAVRQKNPLGQTVHCLLIPPANRNAISQRSPGCSGQAEMPGCIGVSPPRQVVPGLHLVFICLLVVEFFCFVPFSVLTLFHAVLFQFCVDFSVFLCKCFGLKCRILAEWSWIAFAEDVFANSVLPLSGQV